MMSDEGSQPRKKRILGSPVSKPIPHKAKNWLLKPELRSSTVESGEPGETAESHDLSQLSDASVEY